MSNENIKKMTEEVVEFNLKNMIYEFSEDCFLGKSTKLPYKTVDKISKEPNNVVIHSGIVGQIKTQSLKIKGYNLTYLCEVTEYSFVYLLKK